jgi:alkanesulfonate monooxygenase SsuD/methylene tetrahydromethanopterin reductase-like flavin-dependent oxidoreductase (luciferase family)
MRVGVSLRSAYAPPDGRTGARWMVEQAATAWEAGLDSLFVGDHHSTGGAYYQNSPILGRLLAEWGPRAAGGLYLLPLWNPVLVAEQAATLAAIAEGPFVLQCAIGSDEGQFRAMGAHLRRRAHTFEQHLATVRTLLAGDDVRGARIGPVPSEPVEVWIGGSAPPAIDRAARLGDAWLAGPELVPDAAAEKVELYRERCGVHGRVPTAVAGGRDDDVGGDDDDAWRVARPILDAGSRGFDRAAPIVGGPAEVAEQFRSLSALGYTDVIVRPLAERQADALACLSRLEGVRASVTPD